MTVDEVVDVVTVRHGGVTTSGTVHVPGLVAPAPMVGGAVGRIERGDRDGVFVDVIAVGVVEMSVVQVVDMPVVLHREMPAVGAVNVGVVVMGLAAHGLLRPGRRCLRSR